MAPRTKPAETDFEELQRRAGELRAELDAKAVAKPEVEWKAAPAAAVPLPPLRHAGEPAAVVEPWRPGPKRLRIVERDGRETVMDLQPEMGGWLVVESRQPKRGEPWVLEEIHARVGLFSVETLELVDVLPDEAA